MIVKIDEMTEGDIDEVLAIEEVSFIAPWSRGLFVKELENRFSHNLLAKRSGEGPPGIIGYIVFWDVADETHLLDLAVHPDCRRTGVASLLLEKMLAIAGKGGMRRVILELRRDNDKALSLYGSFCFKEIGLRKKYYSDGEDAIVMALELETGN
ncbi:MAG: ribosomal protein S18-alanine N-acetyltransferase [Proteobacteria bacterium]|nr:ribosomal protein S18-alanine N-acetyltransferase [Pseudomonadota bacterium]